jgi:peptidoglycan/LPS O-acetylase OafA/YrhL
MRDAASQAIPGLTGLRALAALWVLGFHYFGMLGPRVLPLTIGGFRFEMQYLLTVGWVGVHIFFVLSGFLLARPFVYSYLCVAPQPRLRSYLMRRLFRVFPAYWAVLLVLICWCKITGAALPSTGDLIAFFFMVPKVDVFQGWAYGLAFWTLPVEFEFYLVLPLLAWLFFAEPQLSAAKSIVRCGIIFAAALLITILYRYGIFAWLSDAPMQTRMWYLNQLPALLPEFLLGIGMSTLLIYSQTKEWRIHSRFWDLLMCAGLLGIIFMMIQMDIHFRKYWDNQPMNYYYPVLTGFFISCLVLGVAGRGRLGRLLFENKAAFAIGTISYSIYLWHYPVGLLFQQTFRSLPAPANEIAFAAAAVTTTMVLSTLSYLFVERPFVALSGRPRLRKQGETVPACPE